MKSEAFKRQPWYSDHLEKLKVSFKWIGFGLLTGIIVGFCASIFAKLIVAVTALRLAHTWILYFLPLAGIPIVWLYHKAGSAGVGGTNMVLSAIREEKQVPGLLAPLIFISTVLTHMFGGSAGREGAALQMGGSMGNMLGQIFRFGKNDRRRVTMCGMSAAFSALFGTPLAAAVMPMEISTVGIIYYSALVPCAIASLTAHQIAKWMGLESEAMLLSSVPAFTPLRGLFFALFAVLCALVSILFCTSMHKTEHLLSKHVKNDYVKIVSGGILIILLTILVGDQTYNGAGSGILASCVLDPQFKACWYMFLLKILFTVVTLSAEYKGGEIVPSLFIGATFGNFFGNLPGQDPALCAAVGMACVFCGVTNCPLAALLISFELFGFEAMPYLLLAVSLTYLFSGNYGIYTGQTIRYSKFTPGRIDAKTH